MRPARSVRDHKAASSVIQMTTPRAVMTEDQGDSVEVDLTEEMEKEDEDAFERLIK